MKRLITVALILAALLPAVAFSDSSTVRSITFKLATMELEDLYQVNEKLQQFIFKKESSVNGVTVPQGFYTVGTDIPAGTYRVELQQMIEWTMGYMDCKYADGSHGPSYNTGTIGKLELTDGMTVEINLVDAVFYTYTGLFQ